MFIIPPSDEFIIENAFYVRLPPEGIKGKSSTRKQSHKMMHRIYLSGESPLVRVKDRIRIAILGLFEMNG